MAISKGSFRTIRHSKDGSIQFIPARQMKYLGLLRKKRSLLKFSPASCASFAQGIGYRFLQFAVIIQKNITIVFGKANHGQSRVTTACRSCRVSQASGMPNSGSNPKHTLSLVAARTTYQRIRSNHPNKASRKYYPMHCVGNTNFARDRDRGYAFSKDGIRVCQVFHWSNEN